MTTYTPYYSPGRTAPAWSLRLRAAWDRYLDASRVRAELRRQSLALEHLDDHLRADIGLPQRRDSMPIPIGQLGSGIL